MLSHQFTRPFQPDRIRHPRDFQPLAATFWQQLAIFLEIGAGKGKHALSFASDNANAHLIAIERTAEKYQAMQKMANQAKLSNLTTIHADAIAWVTHAVPAQSLSGVFILYPNPEPHNPNQRWLNMPFFEWLLSRLKPGGELIIARILKVILMKLSIKHRRFGKYRWRKPKYPIIVNARILR